MEINKTYELPFSLETVYSFWVSSNTVIAPATRMDIDPVIGGHYRLFMDSANMQLFNEGEFIEIEPNRRLKYTWEWNKDGEITEILVEFLPINSGTKIDIVHQGFNSAESAQLHSTGWDSYITGFSNHILSTIDI